MAWHPTWRNPSARDTFALIEFFCSVPIELREIDDESYRSLCDRVRVHLQRHADCHASSNVVTDRPP